MKRYKKTLSYILLFTIIFAVGLQNVYASEKIFLRNIGIEPYTYTACEYGNGIHQAERRGTATIITVGGTVLMDGTPCWQCKNCYLVIATSGDPTATGGIVGYYYTRAYIEPIGLLGAIIQVPNNTVLPYVNSKTLEGFRFFNNTSG